MDMLDRSKDEIDACPYIEVKTDVTDKFSFYKTISCKRRRKRQGCFDKETKILCHLGNIKKNSTNSSLFLLMSRKVTKDEKIVSDLRYVTLVFIIKYITY